MKILKMVVRVMAALSLAAVTVTGKIMPALMLLIFGSMSMGIIVGENIHNEEKDDGK